MAILEIVEVIRVFSYESLWKKWTYNYLDDCKKLVRREISWRLQGGQIPEAIETVAHDA